MLEPIVMREDFKLMRGIVLATALQTHRSNIVGGTSSDEDCDLRDETPWPWWKQLITTVKGSSECLMAIRPVDIAGLDI